MAIEKARPSVYRKAMRIRIVVQAGWVLSAVMAVLMGFGSTGHCASAQTEDIAEVSLVQLIATPDRFAGKRVIVYGVYKSDFESRALFLTKDDAVFGIRPNSVALALFEEGFGKTMTKQDWKRLNGSYVRVVGVFRSGPSGHMSLWGGELIRISSISALKK